MSDDFNYKCGRRSGGRLISPTIEEKISADREQLGAGSGGDTDWERTKSCDNGYQIRAPIIDLLGRGSPWFRKSSPHQINLLALENDGRISMRAGHSMEISTGPADPANPVYRYPNRTGVTIRTADSKDRISLLRGFTFGKMDKIDLTEDYGIYIESEHEAVMINSPKEITLTCGLSSISIKPDGIEILGQGPDGVTIQGVPVKVN